MRCIPEDPEFGEGQLAEEAVWTALKNSLPDECVLAHSVHVRDGRNEYEIDLLVLWPGVGMAAIEVKGAGSASQTGSGTSRTGASGARSKAPWRSPKAHFMRSRTGLKTSSVPA
jgi:hypothetical protein